MSMNVVRKQAALATRKLRVRRTVNGETERPRLSVYRSEKHIYGQIVDDVSGRTLAAASTISRDLRDIVKELSPKDAATKVGEHLAEKAKASGVSKVVFDRGGRRYTGRVAALADGARSKGLQF